MPNWLLIANSFYRENAITYAFKTNNIEAMKVLLDAETIKKPRAPRPGYALAKEYTGSYSKYAFIR